MIKRDGVEVMNERTQNVKLAKETIEICKQKKYTSVNGKQVDISSALDLALEGTILYKENLPGKDYRDGVPPVVEVTNETTAVAGARLIKQGKTDTVILNFASARNQGGGFLSGAIAQEEDLCRASGLYPCLKSKPIFYNENIMCDDLFYTDNVIYSPNVPFFRNEHNLLLDDPFTLSVISAPAPNVRSMEQIDGDKLSTVIANRTLKILEIAEAHGHKTIILGAWGCGAFGNNPSIVASIFMAGIMLVPSFEHVCFAVYDTREPPVLYDTFKETCDSVQASWLGRV